ncbi:MAG TPA: hypothetical protein VJ483_10660 [Holophagaceae bacterium]|nr:hypothetical protein [Holophagaceae bacterium]
MKVLRQLGSCGTALILGPLLWTGACFAARALAQNGYRQITDATREFRVPQVPILPSGEPITDGSTLTELRKYTQVWELEPGACRQFPDRDRWPWSWNPFHASALMLRLKQKQSFLKEQRHLVLRWERGGVRTYLLAPDANAALGGRSFRMDVKDGELLKAWELK